LAPRLRARLIELRELIYATAEATPGVGALVETLKWGEPAYHPAKARIGTTLRINAHKNAADTYAIYVPCQTTLMAEFRDLYPGVFRTEGERALLFAASARTPVKPLRHCIGLALT
jgi:hypothetical protein